MGDDEGMDAGEPLDAGEAARDANGMQTVMIRFKGKIGERDLVCGETYAEQGSTKVDATPQDFRFFVQEVRLVRKGTQDEVKVQFDDAAPFQRPQVALIDFTDAADNCGGTGGSVVNTVIRGQVPAGEYEGIVFTNGVPEELNHAGPAETAGPPLDDVTLFWNWLGGYRFIAAELLAVSDGQAPAADAGGTDAGLPDAGANDSGASDAVMVDADAAGGADGASGTSDGGAAFLGAAFVHVGSTGCSGSPGMGFTCARQARNEVHLAGFDPTRNVVIADLGAIFENSDLTNPPQCHGVAPPCAEPYAALGIDMDNGQPAASQRVFRVE